MVSSRRTRLARVPAEPIEPINVRMKKARHLPMPGPGIVVSVPLGLLPEYLDLYSLEPMERGEVIDHEIASKRNKPSGMLYVKRTPALARGASVKPEGKK